jgi:hypothetical protein
MIVSYMLNDVTVIFLSKENKPCGTFTFFVSYIL